MEKHDIWKTKEKCKRHGFQLVNTIEYQGEIYTGECPYCKEERDLNRFHARLASFHVYDTLDAIPLCYRKKTINGYLTDGYEDRVAAVNACLAIQDEKLSTVIMIGGKGNGKTHLLIATVMEMLGQGKRVRYVTEEDLLEEIEEYRGPFTDNRSIVSRYCSYDVLAIDDFGIYEELEGCSADIMRSIINKRHEGMRQTMLAGNLTIQKLSAYYGNAQFRRLSNGGRVIELKRGVAG